MVPIQRVVHPAQWPSICRRGSDLARRKYRMDAVFEGAKQPACTVRHTNFSCAACIVCALVYMRNIRLLAAPTQLGRPAARIFAAGAAPGRLPLRGDREQHLGWREGVLAALKARTRAPDRPHPSRRSQDICSIRSLRHLYARRGAHRRRSAPAAFLARVRSRLQERLHHRRVPAQHGASQCRVGAIDVRRRRRTRRQ